jgi:hypothetical protein
MLGLFHNRPPLPTHRRVHIERLLRQIVEWLPEITGAEADIPRQLSELPLRGDRPEKWLESAVTTIGSRMGVSKAGLRVSIGSDAESNRTREYVSFGDQLGGAAIRLASATLRDPLRSFVELTHEIASRRLTDESFPKAGEEFEDAIELAAVGYGYGILQSDACLYFQNWSDAITSGFEASRFGRLSAQEIGYAMALLARRMRVRRPAWLRDLRTDARVTAKQALDYFAIQDRRHRPLLFDADRIPEHESTPTALVGWISGDDSSFAYAALQRLMELEGFGAPVVAALLKATRSRDADVAPLAITLLAGADCEEDEIVRRIRSLLRDRRPRVALAAAKAAMVLGVDLTEHLGTLEWLLEQPEVDDREVVSLIVPLGHAARLLERAICGQLTRALKQVDDPRSLLLADCLLAVSGNPQRSLRKYLPEGELLDEAFSLLNGSSPRA